MVDGQRFGASRDDWVVRVPASSANLGSAFDAVALALDVHLEVTVADDEHAPETHPAVRAFRHGGGVGPIAVRAGFPGGRGLGFSGAARVGGLVAAYAQQRKSLRDARPAILRTAGGLEGHFDNVAASLYGGVVAVAGGRAVRIPLSYDLGVVVWTPERETATSSARRQLPDQIPFADAAFNIGRTALLVAALAAGDTGALRIATEDRLHQDRRLARAHDTRHAIDAALAAGAFAAWLSGSGPSAAALVDPARADEIAAALPAGGRTRVLGIADIGATVTTRDDAYDFAL
ncbi:MAG: homoserine kinase [Actinomycetota bacterium]|jgi:homoserine kinase|nr:homoserine kinase [Actinomycetota bacterium]